MCSNRHRRRLSVEFSTPMWTVPFFFLSQVAAQPPLVQSIHIVFRIADPNNSRRCRRGPNNHSPIHRPPNHSDERSFALLLFFRIRGHLSSQIPATRLNLTECSMTILLLEQSLLGNWTAGRPPRVQQMRLAPLPRLGRTVQRHSLGKGRCTPGMHTWQIWLHVLGLRWGRLLVVGGCSAVNCRRSRLNASGRDSDENSSKVLVRRIHQRWYPRRPRRVSGRNIPVWTGDGAGTMLAHEALHVHCQQRTILFRF
mmetsp:Transcript_15003/g.27003  ORF Transcript_15003/g.27003 Transcript_15003/m.27003 type:complete len:254 (-) Transcript_15003:71-832(-)